MFAKYHSDLLATNAAYAQWHSNPSHKAVHWMAFISVAAIVTSLLVGTANQTSAQSNPNIPVFAVTRIPVAQVYEPAQDHILVKFKDTIGQTKRAAVLAKHNLTEGSEIPHIGVKLVKISPNDTPEEVVQRLKLEDGASIDFVEVDAISNVAALPNDPLYPTGAPNYGGEWFMPKIQAPAAWDLTQGSSAVIIADIDTGIEATHTDLVAKFVPGWNFYSNSSDTSDVTGHGTATAGISAASTNNALGVASLCWNCKIMPIRVTLYRCILTFQCCVSSHLGCRSRSSRR